jgi:hypothetical protein
MSRIPPLNPPAAPVVTGETASEEASEVEESEEPAEEVKKAADKPYFIYVTGDAPATADAAACGSGLASNVDSVILKDERIALGARAFHAVRMSPEEAKEDPLLQGKGKEVPRLLFVTADLKSVTVLEQGKLSVSGTWDAMRATASKFYKENLDNVVRELRSVLFEYDKIDAQQKVLADKEARAKDKKASAGEMKEIEKDREALAKRLEAAQKKERELFTLKPKSA